LFREKESLNLGNNSLVMKKHEMATFLFTILYNSGSSWK